MQISHVSNTIFIFLCQTYFTLYDKLKVHQCCCQWHYFILFLWVTNIPLCISTTSSLSIHLLIYLGRFHVLAIINSVAMNTGVHVSFQIRVFIFSGYMSRSGIPGLHDSWIKNSSFSFWRKLYTVFHSFCTSAHSQQQCSRVPFSPHPLSIYDAILISVRWYRIVVLICVPLIIGNTEHLFMCLLVICMLSLETLFI